MTETSLTNDGASQLLVQLNDRFAVPGLAQIVAGSGGLPKVRVTSASASAEIYLHGAQLTSWIPAGTGEVLFLSSKAQFEDGRAIRGGVPICFPWFNAKRDDAKAPSHGFVRTKAWQLEGIAQEGAAIAVTFSITDDASTRGWWPYSFRAVQRIVIGQTLQLALTATNTGETPFTIEEALHAYYRVGDVHQVTVLGLDHTTYLDNTESNGEKLQSGDNRFSQRTDNAYIDTVAAIELDDPALNRRILIDKRDAHSTVLWNPWQAVADGMADLGDGEWQQFVCIEAANIHSNAITLQPGEQHTMGANIRVKSPGDSA